MGYSRYISQETKRIKFFCVVRIKYLVKKLKGDEEYSETLKIVKK